ncbi:PREDICTED: uncharacterized protein LOC109160828 [Ipomoea nil]|uniref:uncharacterized protein LOC109160828 n=1 Tax=Ipomoea nil TaxID=35883 RepID=UPI0009019A96|nr:PREDICTED: uncharacterized protein LOC109160828 [Ipomoea nil]
MPKKRSSPYSPIMQKVAGLLNMSLFLAKMRRPIIARLKLSLKNSRKLKRIKLNKHYNYGYIQEYEYSPSNTPLIQLNYYPRMSLKKQDPMFFISRCLGGLVRGEREDENRPVFDSGLMEALPDSGGDEDNSIDERAEEFIERFYEEMRLQRQESVIMKQFDAMVDA